MINAQLKLLKVVLKNLADPAKAQDIKYRQLRLENEKIKSRLAVHPPAMEILKSVGFVESQQPNQETAQPEAILVIAEPTSIVTTQVQTSLQHVTDALATMTAATAATTTTHATAKKPAPDEKLSEKQKARRLLEQKKEQEREQAKLQRKRNVELLKRDKFVRENDENWTSGVSAAAGKSGSSISTFRDKYGE